MRCSSNHESIADMIVMDTESQTWRFIILAFNRVIRPNYLKQEVKIMNRRITVKGTGHANVKPDLIVLKLELTTKHNYYEETMKNASKASQQLLEVTLLQGFDKDDLKTTDFKVDTVYHSYRDKNDNYQKRFAGYKCQQNFRLEFDLDFECLSQILTALMRSSVDPVFDIQFTVKDSASVSEELLRSAAKNAKEKAEILADASGIQLGNIINIDYNWARIDLYSQTVYQLSEEVTTLYDSSNLSPHIVPEEINVSDTVTFVWEIY